MENLLTDITLTDEQRETLAHFASLLFTDDELAEIMEIDPAVVRTSMKMKKGEIYREITTARYQSEAIVRDGILKMAARGSTPAQNQAVDMLKRMKKDNV